MQDFPIHFKMKWKISSAYPGVNSNSNLDATFRLTLFAILPIKSVNKNNQYGVCFRVTVNGFKGCILITIGNFVTTQVQSSMVHGLRLTDEKCDPAARRCRLQSGEAKSRF